MEGTIIGNVYCSFKNKGSYRFGFNGKMKDNELYGLGNSIDYDARFYSPRLGRPLSVDPLAKEFPMLSPYQFFSNNPVWYIDLDGKEGIVYTVNLWKTTSGETAMSTTTSYDVGGNSAGVLYKIHDLDTRTYKEHYIPDIEVKPSEFQNWMSMQKKAFRNDLQGSTGYEAVGQHVVSGIANGLSLMIGMGEMGALYKGAQGLGGALRLGVAGTDLILTGDDFIKDVGGMKETPLEMVLSDKGDKGLSTLKLGMSLRGSVLGLNDLKKSIKTGGDADKTATNLYQTGKSLYDSGKEVQELKSNNEK